jgi:hypothetical protein
MDKKGTEIQTITVTEEFVFFLFWRNSPLWARGFSITHNDAPQLVGLLWTSDQLVKKTST